MSPEIAADLESLQEAVYHLPLLADWFDLKEKQADRVAAPGNVQADLREWAGAIRRLRRDVPALLERD